MTVSDERFSVRIDEEPIAGDPVAGVADETCGAVATFRGVVRARGAGRPVVAIEYECYREMAEREMMGVVTDVAGRYDVHAVRVVHRTGRVSAGETSILVTVSAAHRAAAFDALRAIVDELKKRAPIWKKEHYADGASSWL